jgi:hypothetical protein
MPDWPSVVRSVATQREFDSSRTEKERAKLLGINLFFWIFQAAFTTLAVALILGQSYLEWGGFPSAAGTGAALYVLVGLALACVWTGAGYSWYLWRQPM